MPPVQRESAAVDGAVWAAGRTASVVAARTARSARRACQRRRGGPAMRPWSPGSPDPATGRGCAPRPRTDNPIRRPAPIGGVMETVAVVLNVRNEHVEAFEAGFREHELPVWRDLRDRGLLDRATLNRLD